MGALTPPMAVPTLDDAARRRRRARQARVRARRPERAARGRRDRATTRACARRCRRCGGCSRAGARVVLASHLGRPKGKRRARALAAPGGAAARASCSARRVASASDCIGAGRRGARSPSSAPGQVLLLENLRFHAGRGGERPRLRDGARRARRRLRERRLRHRAPRARLDRGHRRATSRGVAAGDLLRERARAPARRARAASGRCSCILGGAKVSDKLAVLEALAPHADVLADRRRHGLHVPARARASRSGASLVEPDASTDARRVLRAPRERARPAAAAARRPRRRRAHRGRRADAAWSSEIPDGWIGVDIGPETAARYAAEVARARTIFWNGPMGVFEIDAVRARHRGGRARGRRVERASRVVGGGDSLAAIATARRSATASPTSRPAAAPRSSTSQGLELPGVAALER